MKTKCVFIILAWLALFNTAIASRPSPAEALVMYQKLSGVTVTALDAKTLSELLDGETVYRTIKVAENDNEGSTIIRIVGYRLIDAPRESLWLAALAYDGNYSNRLTEFLVTKHDYGGATWYQHVNMPWPLRNRHWLIRTEKNIDVSRQTDDAIWEHHWRLEDDSRKGITRLARRQPIKGLSGEDFRKAIILPRNNGAWVMVETDQQKTLVIIHATMDMGGMLPDGLVARSTRKQLQSMLRKIERDAPDAFANYDISYPIYRGDGTLIPPAGDQGKLPE